MDWSKDWKAMGIFSADLREDLEERRYLQLHNHFPVFTLSLSHLSQSQWEFRKRRTLPKMLPFFFFFLASLLRSSVTTHCCSRDINPCCMPLKCYQNTSRYCVFAWTKLSSFRAACFHDLTCSIQAHYSFLCKYSTVRVRDFFVSWKQFNQPVKNYTIVVGHWTISVPSKVLWNYAELKRFLPRTTE